ncbi:MAG: hypothetical protein IIA98_09585 [Proteobacteria bacterium]|nr:hypothetical protein [Pseudomonadota bacterium]
MILSGAGSPENAVIGSVGYLYLRADGGPSTTMYVKESGDNTDTGWISKPTVYVVALGADGSESDADISPYDSRAGCRLDYQSGTDGRMQDGNSPGGGGAIVSWGENRVLATPPGYANTIFEYQWVEVSDSGVSAKITPVAASTFDTFDATKTWYATKTTAGSATWAIDITVREIADISNTDTRRYTLTVEGII